MLAIKVKYECPSCGNILKAVSPATTIIMLKKTISEPDKCGCGRTSKFKILSFKETELVEVKEKEE